MGLFFTEATEDLTSSLDLAVVTVTH